MHTHTHDALNRYVHDISRKLEEKNEKDNNVVWGS